MSELENLIKQLTKAKSLAGELEGMELPTLVSVDSKLMLSLKEAAELLGTSYTYIREQISIGTLPCVRAGVGSGHLKIRRKDLDRFVENLEREDTEQVC